MVERLGFARPMLVDDLQGRVHHAYGRLPNMTYIVNRGGSIVYRAAWTDPRTIRLALEQLLFERDERRARRRITPYFMERQPHRTNDDVQFVENLHELGGARPVEEFIAAMEGISWPRRHETYEGVVVDKEPFGGARFLEHDRLGSSSSEPGSRS